MSISTAQEDEGRQACVPPTVDMVHGCSRGERYWSVQETEIPFGKTELNMDQAVGRFDYL